MIRERDDRKLVRRRVAIGALLLTSIVVFRGRSFFTPFADPTPGLYLHVAAAWLRGDLPYATTWDYRPPGYFALYALAMAVAGPALARDLLAVVALAATALAAGLIAYEIDADKRIATGTIAAAFVVLLSPANDGVAGVAELQIAAFIAWANYLALVRASSPRFAAGAGLLAAMAIQCKLSAVPLAVVPIVLIATRSQRGRALRSLLTFAAGFALPIVADVALYARSGALRSLWDANVTATIARAQSAATGDEFARNRGNVAGQLLALAPQIEFALLALAPKVNGSLVASAGWLLAALLSICAAGEFYERQFVLLAAPVAILGALGLQVLTHQRFGVIAGRRATIAAFVLTFALHDYFETNQTIAYALHRIVLHDSGWRLDQTAEAQRALACLPTGRGELFAIEQSPFLYDLLGDPAPTKYAYTDLLLDPRLSIMAGIDGSAELARIFATHPQYVVVSNLDDFRYAADRTRSIREALATRYALAYRARRFRVYRNRSAARTAARIPCSPNARARGDR